MLVSATLPNSSASLHVSASDRPKPILQSTALLPSLFFIGAPSVVSQKSRNAPNVASFRLQQFAVPLLTLTLAKSILLSLRISALCFHRK